MMASAANDGRIWPVILSGGSGTRLWPLSRVTSPKQLLALTGDRTMLQETALRRANRDNPPLVICGKPHAALIAEQLAAINVRPQDLVVEPCARNTAAAVAFAAHMVASFGSAEVMLVMPSDHVITRPDAFAAAIDRARAVVADGWLVTFGITPAGPETGYGYIEIGEAIGPGVRAAARFIEKPDRARAEAMLAQGGFVWNGGIFMFRADALLAAMADHAPEVAAAAAAAYAHATRDGDRVCPDAAAFAAAPSISLDYAVMEKAARVAVVPVDMGWSDIGSWDALRDNGPADADGNVCGGSGRVEALDSHGCLLRAEGVTLSAIGVSGLNIVATPDAVLVTAQGRSQEVRDVAARLTGDPLLQRPTVSVHSWGSERLVNDIGVGVRRIDLLPGADWRASATHRLMLLDGAAECDGIVLILGEFFCGSRVTTAKGAALLAVAIA